MTISRHRSSRPDTIQQEFDNLLKRESNALLSRFAKICEDPHSFGLLSLKKRCENTFCWAELAHKNSDVSYSFLLYAHQFGYNSCLLRYYEQVALVFGKTRVSTTGDNTQPGLPIDYLTDLPSFIFLSIILRDPSAQTFYAGVKLQPHENQMYAWRSPFVYAGLLQALCQGNEDRILSALAFTQAFEQHEMEKALSRSYVIDEDWQEDSFSEYSTGSPATDWEKEQTQALKLPLLAVLQSILDRDEVAFNEALLVALQKHKSYYEGEDEYRDTRTGLPEGWLSLPLIAACSLAHQRGLLRSVTSDYIPEWMVRGEFEGLPLLVE